MRSNLLSLWKACDRQIDSFMMKFYFLTLNFCSEKYTDDLHHVHRVQFHIWDGCLLRTPTLQGTPASWWPLFTLLSICTRNTFSGRMSVQWWWCIVLNVSETLLHHRSRPHCVLPLSGNHIQVLCSSVGCLSPSAADRLTAYPQPLGKPESQLSHALLSGLKIHT